MNKLGMHIHGMKPGIIQAVELLQPRTITMMDPTPQELGDIYNAADPIIVVRKYEDGRGFTQTDPRWWAEEYYRMVGDAACNRLVALGWNEPFGHDSRALCPSFDEWNYAFIRRCRELGPMDGGALAMATGNWTGANDRYKITDDFPLTCGIAKWFLPHEYSWPNLQAGAGWYALRFKAWIEDLKAAGRDDFHFIISEAGLTQAVIPGRPDEGWRSESPENVTEDLYITTLDWYNARLCEVLECIGCCLYDYAGQWYNWPTFEQLGLEHRIYQIQAPEPPEPPEPPNGGDNVIPDRVKIYDFDHGPGADDPTTSKEWLNSIFGPCINVHPVSEIHTLQPGDRYYQLQWINCKPGTTSVIIELRDEDGQPVVGDTIIFRWPSADQHGYADHGWNWTENGAPGKTDANGIVGPVMSKDAYYSPDKGECGVFSLWAWDYPTEMVDGVGMLPFHDLVPGANHLHTEYGFKLARWGEEPPVPPVNGELLNVAKKILAVTERIEQILLGNPPELPEPEVFTVTFFNNIELSGAPVHTLEETAPFAHDWGLESPVPGVVNEDFISGRWVGTFTFAAGTHRFRVRTDDGARLWVDGNLVLDKWVPQAPTTYYADVTLSVGEHVVVVEWFEQAQGAVLEVSWGKEVQNVKEPIEES